MHCVDEGATFFSKVCLFPANSPNEMLGKWLSDFHLDLWPSIFCFDKTSHTYEVKEVAHAHIDASHRIP